MLTKYDLHCHSTASDGGLAPSEVVKRAHEQGVNVLALTDHDTIDGLTEARLAAGNLGLQFINGIELSACYQSQCLHIIGLNIDPQHPILLSGIAKQHLIRTERAQKIADKLEKKGIPGVYQAISLAVGNGEITRSHFADYLLTHAYVTSHQDAFDRYLSKGKPAFVPTVWASLEDVVAWIRAAGGIAILAHPLRYKLSAKWMNRALAAFKVMGGQGIEVVTGRAGEDEIRLSAAYAVKHQLFASMGSDFHAPDNQWLELGRLAEMPKQLQPIWQLF